MSGDPLAPSVLDLSSPPNATELAEACHHLMHVWAQYVGNGAAYNQRPIRLPHSFMRAGEDATDFLQRHGYATDAGDHAVLTSEGEALFDLAFD